MGNATVGQLRGNLSGFKKAVRRRDIELERLRSYLKKMKSAFDDKQISGSVWFEGVAPIPLGEFIERALTNRK